MNEIIEKKTNALGKIISVLGIILNVFLAGGKILIGSLFGLISVVADGLNNLTDCGSSVLSLVSFKISSKKADREHPFGHGRIEYICSLVIAFLMFFVAFDTIKESISKIISPTETDFSGWIIAILSASIIIKFSYFILCRVVGKKINSSVLLATSLDSLMDSVATTVTLAAYIISIFTKFNTDGYAGILIALFIAWMAYSLTKEMVSTLIGQAPSPDLVNDIKNKILAYDGVLAIHDLFVYSFGPNALYVSAHIEVNASVDVLISHELIDKIERDFYENDNIRLTGHLDPIESDNPELNELKAEVEKVVTSIDKNFTIHDFRIVRGKLNSNLLFDVAVPYETSISKEEIKERIAKGVKEIDNTYSVIATIEYETL